MLYLKRIESLTVFLLSISMAARDNHVTEHEYYNELYNSASAKHFFENLMHDDIIHEFRAIVIIQKGTEECYYEECDEGAQLLASFQDETPPSVTSNGLLQASLRFPNGSIVENLQKPAKSADFDHTCTTQGEYKFCIENTVAESNNEKKVHMEIVVVHHQDITDFHYNYQENIENHTMYNLYDSIFQRARDVALMKHAVIREKVYGEKDWNLVLSNNRRIAIISSAIIGVILLVTFGQVFFLKRLFRIDDYSRPGRKY